MGLVLSSGSTNVNSRPIPQVCCTDLEAQTEADVTGAVVDVCKRKADGAGSVVSGYKREAEVEHGAGGVVDVY